MRDIDLVQQQLTVRESVYDGHFGTPKTEAGVRQVPLSSPALKLMSDWKEQTDSTGATALVFGTAVGTPLAPNNVLRRHVSPACKLDGSVRDAVKRVGKQLNAIERSADNSADTDVPPC